MNTEDYARMIAVQQQARMKDATEAYIGWLAHNPHVEDTNDLRRGFIAGYLEGFSDAY